MQAGRTPPEAVNNFLNLLQRSLSCLTRTVIHVKDGDDPSSDLYPLSLQENPCLLGRDRRFTIKVIQHYRVIACEGIRGRWKVTEDAYYYTLGQANGPELIGFHLHPHERTAVTYPHLHVYPATRLDQHHLIKTPIPTGRVSLEAVLRYAITELGVEPLRPDWTNVLGTSREFLETWRGGGR